MFPLGHDFDVDDYDVPGQHNEKLTSKEKIFFRILVKEGEADKLRTFTGYFGDKPSDIPQTEIDEYWARLKVKK